MSRKVVCLDTERSCWEDKQFQKSQVPEVFEFGMSIVNLESMVIERSGRYYVKNTRHDVSEFCTKLTGIKQSTLNRQGIEINRVCQLLSSKWSISNDDIPIVAWGDDKSGIEKDLELKGVSSPLHNNYINLAKYYKFNNSSLRNNPSLTDVCARYNVKITHPQHSAMNDAITTANLLLEMVKLRLIWPSLFRG